jgi:hypothetical protein
LKIQAGISHMLDTMTLADLLSDELPAAEFATIAQSS